MTNRSSIEGQIWDEPSGRRLEARVSVIASTGEVCIPPGAIRSAAVTGPNNGTIVAGSPFFASDGTFSVEIPPGPAQIIVERGTEFSRLVHSVHVPITGRVSLDLVLRRWINMPEQGWFAGNTHVHYPEGDTAAEARLHLDPRVEDLPVLVVSVLQRRGQHPASNAFPVGLHPFTDSRHVIDIGEETRHNVDPWVIGLGHLMLLNLQRVIDPVSRGVLVDDSNPDYPPLIDACDAAHADGGVALWCHNGIGMEAPAAAVLGRLDGMNIFDPCWMDPEYAIWYGLLDCGIHLPISTGSDWYVCSSNRVYVDVGSEFEYPDWLAALKAGRTFATNGPILELSLEGMRPGEATLEPGRQRRANAEVRWTSDVPVDMVELVADGTVVAAHVNNTEALRGTFSARLDVGEVTWLAARATGANRARFNQAIWAHTSPIYVRGTPGRQRAARAAIGFAEGLRTTQAWLTTKARFDDDGQRQRMVELFTEARDAFLRLA